LDFCNRDEFINSAYDDTVWKGPYRKTLIGYSFIAVRKKFFRKIFKKTRLRLIFHLTFVDSLCNISVLTISGEIFLPIVFEKSAHFCRLLCSSLRYNQRVLTEIR
jgi:hypothetical protein